MLHNSNVLFGCLWNPQISARPRVSTTTTWWECHQGSFLLEQWRNLYALMHHREDMAPQWVAVVRYAVSALNLFSVVRGSH